MDTNDTIRQDGPLRNVYTGMGVRSTDPSLATTLNPDHRFLGRSELGAYHRLFWQCRKIVDIMPVRMTRRWGTYSAVIDDGEQKDKAEMAMNKILWNYRHKFRDAQRLANLHGNAAIVLISDRGSLGDPINFRSLGKIIDARVVGRWSIIPDTEGMIWNFNEVDGPEWFRPYAFLDQQRGGGRSTDGIQIPERIHKSHVLWFRGNEILDEQERYRNSGCDDSVLQVFYETLHRFQSTYDAGFRMLSSGTLNHQIEGLSDLLKTGGEEAQTKLIERAQLDELTRSSFRQLLSDKSKESYQFLGASLGGASEIMEIIKNELVAAASVAGIPPSLFYAEFSSGMDSAGKDHSERQTLNAAISDLQEQKFAENIEKLVKILHAAKDGPFKGKSPDDWRWTWTPLYDPTPQEIAMLKQTYAMVDQANMGTGVYDADVVRRRYTGPTFQEDLVLTPEDLERIAKASEQQGDPMGGGMPGGDGAGGGESGGGETGIGEAVPEPLQGMSPQDLDNMSVEELEELEGLLGGGTTPGVGTEEPPEEDLPEAVKEDSLRADSQPRFNKSTKKFECRTGVSRECGMICIPKWKKCRLEEVDPSDRRYSQEARILREENLRMRQETANDRYEQLREIGRKTGPEGQEVIMDVITAVTSRKWPVAHWNRSSIVNQARDEIERKIARGERKLDRAYIPDEEKAKIEQQLELDRLRQDVYDILGIDDMVDDPAVVKQDIQAFKEYLKQNQGREEKGKSRVKTGLKLTLPKSTIEKIKTNDEEFEAIDRESLDKKDQRVYDLVSQHMASRRNLEALRQRIEGSDEISDKEYNEIFQAIDQEFKVISETVVAAKKRASSHPILGGRIAQIAGTSREALPGYQIKKPKDIAKTLKKAAEEPC